MEQIINWVSNKNDNKLKLTPEEEMLVKMLREKKDGILNQYITNLGVSRDFEFNNSTIVLFFYNNKPMFGRFKEYAKTSGYIMADIFKKKSTDFKSRPWRLNLNNIEVIEHNGILTKEEYIRKNPAGYYEFINKINF